MIIVKALTGDQLASGLKRLDKVQGVQQCITGEARAVTNEDGSIMPLRQTTMRTSVHASAHCHERPERA